MRFQPLFLAVLLLLPSAPSPGQAPLDELESDLMVVCERASSAVVSIRIGQGLPETIPSATPTPLLNFGTVGDDVMNELYDQLTGNKRDAGGLGLTREDIQREVYERVESATGMSLEAPPALSPPQDEAPAPPLTGDVRSGTGFLIGGEGIILTIADLFTGYEDNPAIELTWHNGERTRGHLRGLDPKTNIALIQTETQHASPLNFGNARDLRMGSLLISITCPYGFPPSAHVGICSGLNRKIGPDTALATRYERFIQTDLPLYPGGHGGPVLNRNGQVVGMMGATVKQGNWKALSFAIPSNVLKPIANELLEEGSVAIGFLGVRLEESMTSDPLKGQPGVVIAEVMPESPADKAGLLRGDRILSVGELSTNNGEDFVWAVSINRPGTPVDLSIFREGQRQVIPVELAPIEDALRRP